MTAKTRKWAETIIAAALNERDVSPIVELAGRAGVDVDELTRVVDCVFEAMERHFAAMCEPEALLTADDFAELKKFGISAD